MKKYKGFTLIELMIVIVVIGILASMMAIASSESMSTAKASSIVSTLRNFSMAAMALYTDKMEDYVSLPGSSPDPITEKVKLYLHNEGDIPDKGKYYVFRKKETADNKDYQVWWAGYVFSTSDNDRVREKLEGRADSANLNGSDSGNPPADNDVKYKKSHESVWIKIRSSKKK
ncbi:MAG: type II secretion system protein [Synergistaceae bacterium]|nr:type II secretion system protein [Synergistaceae bacterium]